MPKLKSKPANEDADAREAEQGAALLAEAMLSFRGPRVSASAPPVVKEAPATSSALPVVKDAAASAPPVVKQAHDVGQVGPLAGSLAERAPAASVIAVAEAAPSAAAEPKIPEEILAVEPTGRWDDGAKCSDTGGGLLLWCARCGNRPRPEHEFRCRLHDEDVSNADERPAYPANVDDKMKMRRYKKDMDEWQPSWLERDDDEEPPVDEAAAYPCHCPACEGKTVRYGARVNEFATSTRILVDLTEWLTQSYKYAANAPQAVSERRFMTAMGQFGHCINCRLLVQATLETHNAEDQYN